jgi:hypothetical protein
MANEYKPLVGSIIGWEPGQNTLFDPACERNRDDCLKPFRSLRASFSEHGVRLDTQDVNAAAGRTADFNLYIESRDVTTDGANYLLRFEADVIVPRNADAQYLAQFAGVFTWQQDIVDGKRFIKMMLPNPLRMPERFGFAERPDFCAAISANKVAALQDGRELYSKRVEAIRWFERHAPGRFHLYGLGWDKPPKRPGRWGKTVYRAEKVWHGVSRTPALPSYRGPVREKREVLERTRFCICFENCVVDDYITEKIFDCLFAGCLPVYLGAPNIASFVPRECFVDMREFADFGTLVAYLDAMSESEYIDRQRAMVDFLQGPRFVPFSSQTFADTIVDKVLKDFGSSETDRR